MTRVFLTHSWRLRWRGLVVLALMIGLTGAAVLGALAGARRSASALDRFGDAAKTLDVFMSGDVTTAEPRALLDLLDGPLVASTNDLAFVFVDSEEIGVVFAPTSRRGLEVEEGVLLEGRRADPDEPDEVVLSELGASNLGVGVGDSVELGTLSPEQVDAMFSSGVPPTSLDGPGVRLLVVGIARNGFDLSAREGGTALTMTTPAFWERYGDEIGIGSRSHMVRLVDAPDAVARFTDAVEEAYGDEHLPSINVGQGEESVRDSISVITAALVVVALVLAVAGVVWVGATLARQQSLVAPDVEVLRSLGTTSSARRVLLLGSVVPAVVGGVVLALILAVALSPLFPVGAARRVDPDPGLHVDLVTLVAGGTALIVIFGAIAAVAADRQVRQARRAGRSAMVAPRLAALAARWLHPAPATGVRFALHAPPNAPAAVRPALAGAVVGVAGLVAVAIVGVSLQRLVDTPARWGTTWDVAVAAQFFSDDPDPGAGAAEPDRAALIDDADIEAAALLLYDEQVTLDGIEAISMTLEPIKGGITPTVIEGREPRADDEIAVARDTLRAIDAEMGTTVRVTSRSQVSGDYRIVGVIAFPTVGEPTAVATGVSFTSAGGDRLLLGDPSGGDDVGAFYVVVRWAAGVDHDEALEQRGIVVTPGAIDVLALAPALRRR